MYRSKLQELSHKKKWALPQYSCMRDGPPHNPQFKASVVVDGVNFDTETIWKSSKEACNEAAMFAFLHFTSGEGSESANSEGNIPKKEEPVQKPEVNAESSNENHGEKQNPEFKKKLEIFARRNNLGIPTYRPKNEGSSQDPLRFKATVAIRGDSFDSPSSYTNMLEAEDAAAQAALLCLTINAFRVKNTNSYNDKVKELAEKEGSFSPTYTTVQAVSSHDLKFITMVEFNGQLFFGQPANSKKQAEINAAMVAHAAFVERKDIDSRGNNKTADVTRKENSKSTPEEPVALPEMSSLTISEPRGSNSATMERKSYLLCNRVRVYTCIPEIELPEGTVLIPIGESKWVVASLEFPDGVVA